jgi:hypothetical protein
MEIAQEEVTKMTSLALTRTLTADRYRSRNLLVAATFLVVILLALAQNVRAGRAERIEGVVLSPAVTVGLSVGWAGTTYELFSNSDEYYGTRVGNEKIHYYTDHLHLGYGLHMLGFLWRREAPASYKRLPYGARLLFCSGGLIQTDDMYQHLILHHRDGFNAAKGRDGRIAESPLHKLYVAAEQTRRTESYKIMLDLFIKGRLTVAAGYYQGMAAETSYRVRDFGNSRGALSVKCITGIGIIETSEKRLGIEQSILGAGLNLYPTRWCSLEAGCGWRFYSANPRLSSPLAVFYGIELGPRP